jgi:hypothetical protein
LLFRPGDEGFDTRSLAYVELVNQRHGRARLPRFDGDVLKEVNAAGAEQQSGAFPTEVSRGGLAEPAGSAGDQDPLVCER